MRWAKTLILAAIVCAGATRFASAGAVVVVETRSFESTSLSGSATVYLDEKGMRIDSTEGGANVTVIFRVVEGSDPVYWVIDNKTKTYVELTPELLAAAQAQIETARQNIRAQMEGLDPAERAQLERAYGSQLGVINAGENKTEYKTVARGARVKKWSCSHYEGYRNGVKAEEVWAATLEDLGINKKDVLAFAQLADALEGLGQNLPAFFRFGRDSAGDDAEVEGFPIMVVTYVDGRQKEVSEVSDIRQETFRPQLFELPAGLTPRKTGP